MSWKLLGKPVTQKVTKKLAKEFAEMDPAPHDRPLSERRLQVYQRLLADGAFRPVTWASAICTETGGVYRVNGKHTSVLLSGIEKLPEFYVTVEEYECDTLDDVARLYSTFDSNLQSRTARDIYLSFAGTVAAFAEVPAKAIVLAVTGMAYHEWMDGDKVHQPAEKSELMLEYPEFVLWLTTLFNPRAEGGSKSDRNCRHLQRQPVTSAMFGTWRKSRKDAETFWQLVRDEVGTKPSDPDRKLARYLLQVGVDTGGGAKRVRTADRREIYVKCLHAWNAWRKQEATDLRYHADKDVPAIK